MREALAGIPLAEVSTSMTINAPAAVLLLCTSSSATSRACPGAPARHGAERHPQGVRRARQLHLSAAALDAPHGRRVRALRAPLPRFNTISISGYHLREQGCSVVQEVAFTLANGIAYVQAAIDAGLAVDEFAPQLSFFFNAHNDVFQEVAKFRAARRMWAEIMRDRFGAHEPEATMLRFHTQTGGVTLTAQQPDNNIVRVALQGLPRSAAAPSRCTPTATTRRSRCRPSAPPRPCAPSRSSRTSPARPTRSTLSPAPTSSRRSTARSSAAHELIARVDELGGSVAAIGFVTGEIDESAWGYPERYRIGRDIVVGVNDSWKSTPRCPTLRVDPESEREQVQRLAAGHRAATGARAAAPGRAARGRAGSEIR